MLSTYFCYFILLARLALANTPDPGVRLGDRGFNATFFKYELGSGMGWSPGYFEQISKSSLGLETVGKVVDMNFRFEPQAEDTSFHTVYRSRQRVTNMGLRLTAFFRPHASGYYRFNLAANDGAQLTIGPIRWPCEHKEKIESHKLVALRAHGDQSKLSVNEFDVHLIEGYYYPIEVIAFNSQGDASLRLSVTDPRRSNFAGLGYLVHQGTFDKCETSFKASSNSVFADASLPAQNSQTHLRAAPPPMPNRIPPVHGKEYEESSVINDRSGQRSFGSTGSVVNAQIGNTEHLESEDSMVFGRPTIAAEYFDSWGFNIDEYKYSSGGEQGWDSNYFTSPRTGEKTRSLRNIVFINYDSQHPENRKHSSRYGSRSKGTGFEAEMSAHFKAPTSGTYSFDLTADDGAYVSIGPAEIPCGRRRRGFRSIFEMTALTELPRHKVSQKTRPVISHGSVTLQKDMYYPVKVITFNSRDSYSLRLSVTDPSGLQIPDFGNLVFQARDECGPLSMTMPNSLMEAHDLSADTQNGITTRYSMHSEDLQMPDNSTARLNVGFTTQKKKVPDTEYVIVNGGTVHSGIHVHILNTTDEAPDEPDQLSVKSPDTIQFQVSGPDPLSPSELAASGDFEDKAKLLRQFRDTMDPKKQIESPPISKQGGSTRESVEPQALANSTNADIFQVPSKLMEQGATDKNDTSPVVVGNLLNVVTPRKNETKPDFLVGLSSKPTSDVPRKNQKKPDVPQVSSKVMDKKVTNKNGTDSGVVETWNEPTPDVPRKNQKKPGVPQVSSKVMDKKVSNKNETDPGVVGMLPVSATSKKNDTKPDLVQKSSKAAKSHDLLKIEANPEVAAKIVHEKSPERNNTELGVAEKPSKEPKLNDSTKSQPSPAVLQVLPKVIGQKAPKKNEKEPSVSEMLPNPTTPKKNETEPDVLVESTNEPITDDPKKNKQKPGVSQVSSKVMDKKVLNKNETNPGVVETSNESTSDDSKMSQKKPAVLQVSSQVLGQKASENNDMKPGVGGKLPELATPKKNDTKLGVVETPTNEPPPDNSKNNQPEPDVLQMPSAVMGQKVPTNNETEPSVDEESLNAATSKNNDTKPDILQVPSTVMDQKVAMNNETRPGVVEESSKKPTADVSETSDPKLKVAKELSEVARPVISEKNDRNLLNFVNLRGPEKNDPKRGSSGEPSDASMKEVSNGRNADSVVSEKSSKIVIPDEFVNTGVAGEISQDSIEKLSLDSVTDHNLTPDVLEVELRELEQHDQKSNESVVELKPSSKEEQTLDVPEPGAFQAPLVLISGNSTAATPTVDAPADSSKFISDEVKASPLFASSGSLRVDLAGLNLTMIPEVESADTSVIAEENISANSGSEIPAPKDFEASTFFNSADPAFSNISMPAGSVVQMPVPPEIITGLVPENVTSTSLNEQVPADPEDPMPDNLDEPVPATSLAEALAVSGVPLPIEPEDVLEDNPIEISMGIESVNAAYRSEEVPPSLLNDSRAEIAKGLRPAVLEVPLIAASQNLSPVIANFRNSELANETLPMVANSENLVIANETLPVFPNLENLVIANETLPVLANLENPVIANDTLPVFRYLENSESANKTLPVVANLDKSIIANETLSVVAIDEVPETPASEAPIVSIAKVLELKSGASEDPLLLIAFDGSISGPTRFQEANTESVKQLSRDTNSTATSQSAHGTQVESFPRESDLVPDELRTLDVVSNKRLHESKPPVQVQRKPHFQFDQPSLLDNAAPMNSAHGKSREVGVHVAQDAEIEIGISGSSTLNADSDPPKSTSDNIEKSFNENEKEPSTSKLSEAGTMAPVSACFGNNCSSEAAIENVDGTPSIKGERLQTSSANPRMMTLVSHATSAYPSSMPSGEPVTVIMFGDGGPKKIPMLILGTLALEVMIMIM